MLAPNWRLVFVFEAKTAIYFYFPFFKKKKKTTKGDKYNDLLA